MFNGCGSYHHKKVDCCKGVGLVTVQDVMGENHCSYIVD